MVRSGSNHYGLVAMALHWSLAGLFFGLAGLGMWMVGLSYYDPWYHDALALHKALGVVALALVALKLAWQRFDPRPGLEAGLARFERRAATVAHLILAVVLVVVPLSGYVISTSDGAAISVFGLFEVPALFPVSPSLRDAAIAVHFYGAYGGVAVAGAHGAAALKHHFVDGSATLRRMIVPRS